MLLFLILLLLASPLYATSFVFGQFLLITPDTLKLRYNTLEMINKFGLNSDVDMADIPADLWVGGEDGEDIPGAQLAALGQVVSISSLDTVGGLGARTIHVFGTKADTSLFDTIVSLKGLSLKTYSPPSGIVSVHRMMVESAGALGSAADTIKCLIGGVTTIKLAAASNQTQSSHYVVPKGYVAFPVTFQVNGAEESPVEGEDAVVIAAQIQLQVKARGGVWRVIDDATIVTSGAFYTASWGVPTWYDEGSEFKIQVVDINTNDMYLVGKYSLLLVRKV